MKYRLSIALSLVSLFHSINIGVGNDIRLPSEGAESRPTTYLKEMESDKGEEFNSDLPPIAYHRVSPKNISQSTWDRFHIYVGPYINDYQFNMIGLAIDELSHVVCIPFDMFLDENRPRGDYVNVTSVEGGNWADVGRLGGEQTMNLVPFWWTPPTVLRALLYSLGVPGVHNRVDRDDYVTIHWENIMDEYKFVFQKEPWEHMPTYGVPYNIRSLMHYDSWAFSKNGSPTITTKYGGLIGDDEIFTDSDKEMLSRLYNCN